MDSKQFRSFIESTQGEVKAMESKSIQFTDLEGAIRALSEAYSAFREGGDALAKEGDTLKIGIVGQVKAGKSSFLNSLFFDGESVLPKASTPMTAGLTVLEYAEADEFVIEYYTRDEWAEFERQAEDYQQIEQAVRADPSMQGVSELIIQQTVKEKASELMQSAHELVKACGSKAQSKIGSQEDVVRIQTRSELQRELNNYVGAKGEYTSVVKALTLRLKDERLKGIRIVDTPGVNDPIVSRENRTREFLHSCHGVFLLSYASRFFDSTDVSFINDRVGSQGIATIVVLASKYDDVLQDVAIKHPNDLEGADKDCQQSLKKRFREQSAELKCGDLEKIKFDTTSGISYTLAERASKDWDDIERHVDAQMRKHFPSAFTTSEEAKETYRALANLETIRGEYLESEFRAKKDEIINQKIADYFEKNSQDLLSKTDELLKSVEDKRRQLEGTDLEAIRKQQTHQDRLFGDLKSSLQNILGDFQNSLQEKQRDLKEVIGFPSFAILPTIGMEVEIIEECTTLRVFSSTNNYSFVVDAIDTQALKEQLERALEKYREEWYKEWKKHFAEAKEQLFEAFCDAITKAGQESVDLNFSDRYYRNLMDRVLSDIEKYGILELREVTDKHKREILPLCDDQGLGITRSQTCSEGGVRSAEKSICDEASKIRNSLYEKIQIKRSSFLNDIKNKVAEPLEPINKKLSALKDNIDEQLKTAGAEYLNRLGEQIKEKEASLKVLADLKTTLETIHNALKKQ